MEFEIRLTLSRETKNTYKYDDSSGKAGIRTLYIQKDAFPGEPPPQVIVVSVRGDS